MCPGTTAPRLPARRTPAAAACGAGRSRAQRMAAPARIRTATRPAPGALSTRTRAPTPTPSPDRDHRARCAMLTTAGLAYGFMLGARGGADILLLTLPCVQGFRLLPPTQQDGLWMRLPAPLGLQRPGQLRLLRPRPIPSALVLCGRGNLRQSPDFPGHPGRPLGRLPAAAC